MIIVQKNDLLNAIRVVKSNVARIALNPILSTIKIKVKDKKLTLTATDLEGSAKAVCNADVADTNTSFCINANTLDNIINKLNDEICINEEDGQIHIKSGNTLYKINYYPSSEFPAIDFSSHAENSIKILKDDFIDAINKTIISTSNIENSILNGVCFNFTKEGIDIGATDGTRLSQVIKKTDNEIETKFVVPKKILSDLIRNVGDDIEISIEDNKKSVVFKTGIATFKQNLLQGNFPEYQKLIPQEFENIIVVRRKELLSSLEKVMVMGDDKTYVTIFNFKDNLCYLKTSCEYGQAEDFIECDFQNSLKIAFNYKNIYEGLKVMDEEFVIFKINNNQSACVLESGFTYLCMPIRVKED